MTREEAIDVLKHNYPSAFFTELCEAVDIAIKALSAQQEQRWTPVTEDLPKDESVVLITDVYGDIDCDKCLYIEDGTREWCYYYVTAWMPAPEPWKGGAK